MSFTKSIDTSKEIGMKFEKRMSILKKLMMNSRTALSGLPPGLLVKFRYVFPRCFSVVSYHALTAAAITQRNTCVSPMHTVNFPTSLSRCDILRPFISFAFIMIFVSLPVKTTMPMAHATFLTLHPLRSTFSSLSGVFCASWPAVAFKVPTKVYKNSLGCSHSILPRRLAALREAISKSLWVPSVAARAAGACLVFKFVSPSRLAVSMNTWPSSCALATMARSAGTYSFALTTIMLPTRMSAQVDLAKVPEFGPAMVRVALSFSSLSEACRRQSSMASFMALTITMQTRGTRIVGTWKVVVTRGSVWRMERKRK
mmetsp:Transcript_26539/g.76397  ORF Transcript_26539/g.76397 Transcript_26539/m.76397 type:complete len:314 (+) Transcript_26539:2473-3414(+)